MLQELLGIRVGILEELHNDHQEVADLLGRILASHRAEERATLFGEMRAKLVAHAQAEAKVLYARMEKDGEESRRFALEGDVEHEIVEAQLTALARARSPERDEWLARVKVLRELVNHHVREEEITGFASARKQFDAAMLEKLGADFRTEKERRLRLPAKKAAAPKAAASGHAYAGAKPKRTGRPTGAAKRAKKR